MCWRDSLIDTTSISAKSLKRVVFPLGNLQILKHGLTHWVLKDSDEHLALSVDSTAPKTQKKPCLKRVKNALRSAQKHFLKTICGPNSSYSSALIQALPRSGVRARAAPPLHTEKSRSRGLMTRTHALRSAGTMCRISCCRRSGRPGSSVFPPAQNHMLEQLFWLDSAAVIYPTYLTEGCFPQNCGGGRCLTAERTWRRSRASRNDPDQSAPAWRGFQVPCVFDTVRVNLKI